MAVIGAGETSVTGERIPAAKPPYEPRGLTRAEHLDVAEGALEAVEKWFGKPEPGSVSSSENAETTALVAIAHALIAIARG